MGPMVGTITILKTISYKGLWRLSHIPSHINQSGRAQSKRFCQPGILENAVRRVA